MTRQEIVAQLMRKEEWQTQSEVLLARFFLAHLDSLPFETAASIAKRVEVSPVTVGRFLRRLGYRRLSELTRDLHSHEPNFAWQSKNGKRAGAKTAGNGDTGSRQLAALVKNLSRIFEQTSTPEWRNAVEMLVAAENVFVSAFQNGRGIGLYFAGQLGYARPGVEFVDGLNGTFMELFDKEPAKTCLIVIDSRRYAKHSRLLIQYAKRVGIKVISITDIYCQWMDEADAALADPGEGEVHWDSAVSTVALLELLLEGVIRKLGKLVPARIEKITDLQDHFGTFDGA